MNNVQILYIMVGVGFSGKSTLAKQIAENKKAVLVSQDDVWFEKEKEWEINEDSDEDWERVIKISEQKVKEFLMQGKSVVFDHLNHQLGHREGLRKIADECGAKAVVIYLDTPQKVREERKNKNLKTQERHDVKQDYLDEAITELEVPKENEKVFVFKPETNLQDFLEKLP